MTSSNDRRLDALAEHLAEDLTDGQGHRADPEHVAEVVRQQADAFQDAPIQDFVPLLTEHQAREQLRHEGLRPKTADDTGQAPSVVTEADAGDPDLPPPR